MFPFPFVLILIHTYSHLVFAFSSDSHFRSRFPSVLSCLFLHSSLINVPITCSPMNFLAVVRRTQAASRGRRGGESGRLQRHARTRAKHRLHIEIQMRAKTHTHTNIKSGCALWRPCTFYRSLERITKCKNERERRSMNRGTQTCKFQRVYIFSARSVRGATWQGRRGKRG